VNRELLSIEELNLKPGEYAVCLARRNPFSEWYPMVIKRVRNGYVCPVMEQYVTDIFGGVPHTRFKKSEGGLAMKMSKCERCGKTWEYSPLQNVSFPVVYLWIGVEADLCSECRKDLLKWLNGNEKTGEKFKQELREWRLSHEHDDGRNYKKI